MASNGLPSSTEPARIKPSVCSHCTTDRDPISTIQTNGSQRAPVTLGLSRMSRRKRKKTKAIVPSNATCGGKPIILAIVGSMKLITERYQITDVRCQKTENRQQTTRDQTSA